MPHWRKFATSFAKIRRYFFVTFSILPKAATSAAKCHMTKVIWWDHVPSESPINVDLEQS